MIAFERQILSNGLTVVIHQDRTSPMVAVNVLYNVGSKHENPQKTGLAHLFEHLMFGGSINVKNFDDIIQNAGGENNAFTNADMTNFYITLPANNIETALWLESDRMLGLNINQKSLNVQKKVVIEEFKETCLNEPYGDMWHHLSALSYKKHPYQWPTIGKEISHIQNFTLQDITSFYESYYRPNNAILVIAGNIDIQEGFALAEKWFGDIPRGPELHISLPAEPAQQQLNQKTVKQDVPHQAIYMAFHIGDRFSKDNYSCDLISDILATGRSSRFYQKLYKDLGYFSTIDAFISGTIDPGLFVIEGKLMEGISIDTARSSILSELDLLKEELVSEKELTKLKNSVENNIEFGEVSILNKALGLAYFESQGDADWINQETDRYHVLTRNDLLDCAQRIFVESNCNELVYIQN